MDGVGRLALAAGDWALEISPLIGGAVLSLTHRGRDVLRPTPEAAIAAGDVGQTASFAMLPYANRVAQGRFHFASAAHTLRPNVPGSPHPLHGVGWRRPWRIVRADDASAELLLDHVLDGENALDWPFAFEARQRFVLSEAGLAMSIALCNTSDAPAPAGFGWHPYFPRIAGQMLAFQAEGAWRNDDDLLPDKRLDRAFAFDPPRPPLDGIDNDLYGWAGRASLAADGWRTTIAADPLFSHLRLYTPPGQPFLAIEPVSHMADALNRTAEPDHGVATLAPGQWLQGSMRIGVALSP